MPPPTCLNHFPNLISLSLPSALAAAHHLLTPLTLTHILGAQDHKPPESSMLFSLLFTTAVFQVLSSLRKNLCSFFKAYFKKHVLLQVFPTGSCPHLPCLRCFFCVCLRNALSRAVIILLFKPFICRQSELLLCVSWRVGGAHDLYSVFLSSLEMHGSLFLRLAC